MGSSPATSPTQNRGNDVAALKMGGLVLKVLDMLIPLAGSQSELGRAAMDSARKIGNLVPPGSLTNQDIQNMVQQLMLRQAQFGQNMAAMRARQGQPQQGGAPPAGAAPPGAGGGAPPPAMPTAA
jgi:hypothetical protein